VRESGAQKILAKEEQTTSLVIEQAIVQPITTQTEVFKTSTSNPDFVLSSNPSEKREDKLR